MTFGALSRSKSHRSELDGALDVDPKLDPTLSREEFIEFRGEVSWDDNGLLFFPPNETRSSKALSPFEFCPVPVPVWGVVDLLDVREFKLLELAFPLLASTEKASYFLPPPLVWKLC